MKRRHFLLGSGAALAAGAGGMAAGFATPQRKLVVQSAQYWFAGRDQITKGLVSLSPDGPPPVLSVMQGDLFDTRVENTLGDYTAMHWHGLRVPNAMDGVPYLTQFPIGQNGEFDYTFTPQDAGTFWYHPHCMTLSQMASGLTGVLIVKEREDLGFSTEQVLNFKDFRLDEEAQLLPYYTARGAARAGTFGNVISANWQVRPRYDHPAGGLVRLRLVATDTTRLYKLYITGAEGRIIACDGHPVDEAVEWPTEQAPYILAPGQRLDIALKMPAGEGQEVQIMGALPGGARALATLRAIGADQGRDLAEIAPLPRNPVTPLDMRAPKVHDFVFGWTPEGGTANNGFCGTLGYTFWSINRTPWAGDAAKDTGPLAVLERGKTHVLRLRNESPNAHPIHLHGLVFKPLRSNRRKVPQNWTDTALLLKDEVMEVALVADNPGNWAFHCHVIEHQKTGLAGYLQVT